MKTFSTPKCIRYQVCIGQRELNSQEDERAIYLSSSRGGSYFPLTEEQFDAMRVGVEKLMVDIGITTQDKL